MCDDCDRFNDKITIEDYIPAVRGAQMLPFFMPIKQVFLPFTKFPYFLFEITSVWHFLCVFLEPWVHVKMDLNV